MKTRLNLWINPLSAVVWMRIVGAFHEINIATEFLRM